MIVKLTDAELADATRIGEERFQGHRQYGTYYNKINKDNPVEMDRRGARAECAAAKGLGVEWTGRVMLYHNWQRLKSRECDIAGCEVRSTIYTLGDLPIREKDADTMPVVFVLVLGNHTYDLTGWCYAFEGKLREYRTADSYYRYRVPQWRLRSCDELRRLLAN